MLAGNIKNERVKDNRVKILSAKFGAGIIMLISNFRTLKTSLAVCHEIGIEEKMRNSLNKLFVKILQLVTQRLRLFKEHALIFILQLKAPSTGCIRIKR